MPDLSSILSAIQPRWMQNPNADKPVEWFAKGMEIGQQQDHEAIYQQRMKDLDALNKRAKDQEYELNKINIQNAVRTRDEQIQSESDYSGALSIVAGQEMAGIAGTDGARARVMSYIANHPNFYRHPLSKDLLTRVDASAKDRAQADQHETDATMRAGEGAITQAAITERYKLGIEGRADVAQTVAQTGIQKAKIRAQSLVDQALASAAKWRDHAAFRAFSDASKTVSTEVDPVKDPNKYFDAVNVLYEKFLPAGQANEWNSVLARTDIATQSAPATRAGPEVRPDAAQSADPTPTTQAEFDALPTGWFINPKDGRRMWKD